MRNLTKILILFLICSVLYGQASDVLYGTVLLKGRIIGDASSNVKIDSLNIANIVATEKVILDIAAGSLTLQDGTVLYFTDATEADSAYISHDGTDLVITGDAGTTAIELEGLEIELSNGCTVVNTDASNLAITEANVNVVGNLFLDAAAGSMTVSDGSSIVITDGAETDSAYFQHDGTDIVLTGDGGTGDLKLSGIGLDLNDGNITNVGSIDGGSFVADGTDAQVFKAEFNIASQLGSYVHGVKVEMTRTADIQPVTGCWFGGQFVLNAGTTEWDDINKPAYAVQAVIKGDQWDGVQDVNAGRFELQSSGTVDDIVYITANSGTTVNSSMLYMPTHVDVPNAIQINVQSNGTITNGIDFVSGGGGVYKYGIDLSGATVDTADIVMSGGAYIMTGTANPNGSITAPNGSVYIRTGTGNEDSTIYTNTDGSTTWAAADL